MQRLAFPFTLVLFLANCFLTASYETKGYLFEYGDHSYKIVLPNDDRRTWFEAEEICRDFEGGHLASIFDEAENSFLNEKIQLISQSPRQSEELWLGAIDNQLYQRAYRWIDGETFEYKSAFWAPGEPNTQHTDEYDICVALKSTGDLADWIDDDCFEPKGYICKIEGLPRRLVEQKRFGYEFDFGNYIYKFIFMQRDMLSWPEAEIYCRDVEGGHLTSVRDIEETKNIESKMRMIRYYYGFRKMWIGASDINSEGTFEWTDGGSFKYKNWMSGQPTGQHRGMKEDCLAINADPHWSQWSDEYCLHHLPFVCKIRVCNQRADIGFAIDASGSVKMNGFRKSTEFISFVLQRFRISESGIHVGMIRYSHKADLVFNFDKYYTITEIQKAIKNITYVRGGTRTDRALKLARTKLFVEAPEGVSRPNIPKLLVLMTDGISRYTKLTAHEARILKETGVHIIVVAIGSRVYEKELTDIATAPNDIITAASFRKLKKIVSDTKEKVCGGV